MFEALLYFIYNDALPETDRGGGDDDEEIDLVMAQHLLVAADMYSMERLASMCEFTLCIFMNESVAVSTLVLAEQHGRRRLKEACFRMLLDYENYKEVLVGDDLEHLATSCPSVLDEFWERLRLYDDIEKMALSNIAEDNIKDLYLNTNKHGQEDDGGEHA